MRLHAPYLLLRVLCALLPATLHCCMQWNCSSHGADLEGQLQLQRSGTSHHDCMLIACPPLCVMPDIPLDLAFGKELS
jgi:hypothetical protein